MVYATQKKNEDAGFKIPEEKTEDVQVVFEGQFYNMHVFKIRTTGMPNPESDGFSIHVKES